MVPRLYRALLPWIVTLIAAGPLLVYGMPAGDDWSFELVRAREFAHAWAGGQGLLPFWAEGLYGGYGSPIFLFYPPFFLVVTTIFTLALPPLPSMALAGCVLFVLAAISTRWMGRSLGPGSAAVRVTVATVMLSPYFLSNLYLRNANAEFAALCLFPFAMGGVLRIAGPVDSGTGRAGFAGLATGMGAVVLAHNLTALTLLVIVLFCAAMLSIGRGGLRVWWTGALAICCGMGLALVYWLPAFALRGRIRLEDLQRGKFAFGENFSTWPELFLFQEAHTAGLVLPLVVLAACVLLALSATGRIEVGRHRRALTLLVFAVLVLLGLTHSISRPVWATVPLLPLFQFPWRFLGPAGILAGLLAGVCFQTFTAGRSVRTRRIAEGGVLLLCLLNALPVLCAVRPIPRGELFVLVAGANGGATVFNEYVPRGARAGIWQVQPPVAGPALALPSGVEIRRDKTEGTLIAGTVLVNRRAAPIELDFARWFWPEWVASADGRPVPVEANRHGAVRLVLPADTRQFELRLSPPWLRHLALGGSLASLLFFGLCLVFFPRLRWGKAGREG